MGAVVGAGLESLLDSPGNTAISQEVEAESEAVGAPSEVGDSRSAEVIDWWRDFPEAVKQ